MQFAHILNSKDLKHNGIDIKSAVIFFKSKCRPFGFQLLYLNINITNSFVTIICKKTLLYNKVF